MASSAGSADQEQKKNAAAADPSAAVSTAVDAGVENKQEGNRKKMKEIMMPQCEVDYVLSYEPEPSDPQTEAWVKAFDPDLYAALYTFGEDEDRRMLAEKDDFKRQIASKGYVSMMVEVHDEDEESEEEEDEDEEDYVLDHETLEEP
ncbi:unnamed protein product [Urochloa decumbens]|uniref:Uncharacterized protein n=1 Tax=Urochloa decumbens TaxID=240449 RepID=A0ABC8YYM1_9POAL